MRETCQSGLTRGVGFHLYSIDLAARDKRPCQTFEVCDLISVCSVAKKVSLPLTRQEIERNPDFDIIAGEAPAAALGRGHDTPTLFSLSSIFNQNALRVCWGLFFNLIGVFSLG
jgi:hypothetical protein